MLLPDEMIMTLLLDTGKANWLQGDEEIQMLIHDKAGRLVYSCFGSSPLLKKIIFIPAKIRQESNNKFEVQDTVWYEIFYMSLNLFMWITLITLQSTECICEWEKGTVKIIFKHIMMKRGVDREQRIQPLSQISIE